jgi:type III secretion apparatus needle protein
MEDVMSFNIGGLFDVAATAIGGMFGGPIGAMVAQIAKQVISSVVDQVISQLPTDQTTKDLLSTAFHAGMGDTAGAAQSAQNLVKDLTDSTNASPADSAEAQRSVDDMQDAMKNLLTQMVQQNSDSQDNGNDAPVQSGGGAAAKGAAGGGKGWLWAIAEALGKQCNQLADEMQSKADSLDAKDPKSVAEFQTITQQFSLLMNTTTNAIKTLGEAMGNTARKN